MGEHLDGSEIQQLVYTTKSLAAVTHLKVSAQLAALGRVCAKDLALVSVEFAIDYFDKADYCVENGVHDIKFEGAGAKQVMMGQGSGGPVASRAELVKSFVNGGVARKNVKGPIICKAGRSDFPTRSNTGHSILPQRKGPFVLGNEHEQESNEVAQDAAEWVTLEDACRLFPTLTHMLVELEPAVRLQPK